MLPQRQSTNQTEQNYAKKVNDLILLAKQRNPKAQCELAKIYNASDDPKDHEVAFKLFYLSAAKGHAESQYELSFMYANARGVPGDKKKAADWFKLSIAQQHPAALYKQAEQLLKKEAEETIKAIRLYRQAADQGYNPAVMEIKRIKDKYKYLATKSPKEYTELEAYIIYHSAIICPTEGVLHALNQLAEKQPQRFLALLDEYPQDLDTILKGLLSTNNQKIIHKEILSRLLNSPFKEDSIKQNILSYVYESNELSKNQNEAQKSALKEAQKSPLSYRLKVFSSKVKTLFKPKSDDSKPELNEATSTRSLINH